MSRPTTYAFVSSILLSLCGCVEIPPVTVTYYLPTSETTIQVKQTIGCSKDESHAYFSNVVLPTTTFRADTAAPQTIKYSDLDKWYADTGLTIELTEDGRLSGINSSSTGQGGPIVKSALAFVAATAAHTPTLPAISQLRLRSTNPPPVIASCAVLNSWNKGEPVTLTYEVRGLGVFPVGQKIEISEESKPLYGNIIGDSQIESQLRFRLDASADSLNPAAAPKPPHDKISAIRLKLRPVSVVTMNVANCRDASCGAGGTPLWTQRFTLPDGRPTYSLPIARPKPFGKQNFALALAPSGAITKLEYGKEVSIVAAVDAATSSITAAQPEGDRTKADRLQAEADLIVQQHRLIKCQANGDECQ